MTTKTPTDLPAALPANLDMFLDVPVIVTVQLGSCRMSMREVLQLNPGSVVQLDKLADAPVEVLLNDKLVARGEVVVVENKFGIKITEMVGSG
jgi:flagellar motor switch protein FliN/FliY